MGQYLCKNIGQMWLCSLNTHCYMKDIMSRKMISFIYIIFSARHKPCLDLFYPADKNPLYTIIDCVCALFND